MQLPELPTGESVANPDRMCALPFVRSDESGSDRACPVYHRHRRWAGDFRYLDQLRAARARFAHRM